MTPSVIIVFDANFGAQLDALTGRAPIWIIQSAENNPAVARLRETRGFDISTFLPGTLLDWMSVIDEHHPDSTTLEVYGQDLTPDVIDMLREYGDGRYETAPGRFTFSRSLGGQP